MMGPIPPTGPTERATASGWGDNARAAFLVRAVVYSAPLIVAFVATWLVTRWWPAPDSGIQAILRFVVLAAMAMTVGAATDTIAKKFLPLAALLRISLVFPDQAPSRFIVALRSGSARSLKKRLAELESPDFEGTEDQAARLIVELSAALSRHDRLTRGHSERVRAYTALITQEMGLSAEDSNKLQWAALIHDVGKLKIPYEILTKPGKLTDREYATIQTHATEGMYLAAPLAEFLGPWFGAIGEHHERFDGGGYPNGLAGEEISLGARIVAVADAYDVMTAAQSYKKPMSAALARQELADCAGTQFDPIVVRAFLHVGLGAVRRSMWPLSWVLQIPFIGGAVAAPVTQALAASVLTLATATGITAATGGFEPVGMPDAISFSQASATEAGADDPVAPTSSIGVELPRSSANTTTTLPASSTSTVRTTSTVRRGSTTTSTDTSVAPTTSDGVRTTTTTATTTTVAVATTTTKANQPVVTTSTTVAPVPVTTTTEAVIELTDCELVQAGERNLPGADLRGCSLGSVELSGGNFDGANFDDADLSGVTFAEGSLVGSSFDGADLTGVVFDDANLTNASFTQATLTDSRFRWATLVDTNFAGAILEFGSMDHAVLTRSNFVGARLIQWSIKEAQMTNADLSNVEFVESLVKYSNADGATFAGAQIGGLWIYGSSFVEADFVNATGTPEGSESAVFDGTVCPNGQPSSTSCW